MGDPNWSQGAQGALGGAATGAAIGSIVPGIGTGIGAGVGALGGGLLGLFGGGNDEQTRQMLMDYYNQVVNRQAPQLGQAGQAAYSGFRQNQSDLINRLDALSQGKGPSLAAAQFQQATDRNMSSQAAMANSGRGGPMASLTAANNMGMLGAQAAQGSAIARTGEELGAYGQLGQAIAQGRSADEATNMFNTGQGNQFQMANLEAKLKQMGLNDSAVQGILSGLIGENRIPGIGTQLMAGGAGALSQYAAHAGAGAVAGGGVGSIGMDNTKNPFGGSSLGAGSWDWNSY